MLWHCVFEASYHKRMWSKLVYGIVGKRMFKSYLQWSTQSTVDDMTSNLEIGQSVVSIGSMLWTNQQKKEVDGFGDPANLNVSPILGRKEEKQTINRDASFQESSWIQKILLKILRFQEIWCWKIGRALSKDISRKCWLLWLPWINKQASKHNMVKGAWPDHFFDHQICLNFFWDFGTNRWLVFFSFTSWNLAFQNWVFTKK